MYQWKQIKQLFIWHILQHDQSKKKKEKGKQEVNQYSPWPAQTVVFRNTRVTSKPEELSA